MTPAEKMAQRLEVRAEIRRKIPRAEKDRIATDCEDAATLIRRLAAALKDYDEAWDRRDILAIRHADALRDVMEMP